MKYKLIYFVLLFLLAFSPGYCQQISFEGQWYIIYNTGNRSLRGTECIIEIEKTGNIYRLTHLKDRCSEDLPYEGDYTFSNGQLIQGDFSISLARGKLFYHKNGIVEMNSMASFELEDSLFKIGIAFLAKADSFEKPGTRDAILRQSIHINTIVLAAGDYTSLDCYFNRSLAWFKMGKIDSCVADYNRMKVLDSNYTEIPRMGKAIGGYYSREAWDKYGSKGKFKEAVASLQKAITFDSTNANIWYNLGGACYSNKQYTKAVRAFKKALDLDPDNAKAQQGLDAAVEKLEKK